VQRFTLALVYFLLDSAQEAGMSGDKQLKKDGQRKEKKAQARQRDFEQPIVGAGSPQRAQDTSNFSGNDTAGKERTREEAE
jgi:hypothetical protein